MKVSSLPWRKRAGMVHLAATLTGATLWMSNFARLLIVRRTKERPTVTALDTSTFGKSISTDPPT